MEYVIKIERCTDGQPIAIAYAVCSNCGAETDIQMGAGLVDAEVAVGQALSYNVPITALEHPLCRDCAA